MWGQFEQSFIHSSGVCSQYVDCLFAPKAEWLIFPCLFYGTAHCRAWKGVGIHSLQVRQKLSLHPESGQQWHKFIKDKSHLTLDSRGEHFFLVCPTLHNTPLMFIAQLQEIWLKMLPSYIVSGMQETVVENFLLAVTRMTWNPLT